MGLNREDSPEHTIFTDKVANIKSICEAAGNKLLVMHVGIIEQEQVNTISTIVENQLGNMGVSKGIIKRIFNIAIETLQNICFHASKDSNGNKMTYFIIGKHENDFTTYAGNVITTEAAQKLSVRLERLKALNDADLKQEYLEVLSNGELSQKGGAGLGFITIALKSNNHFDFEFIPLNNEYSLFAMKAKVSA